MLHAHGFPPSLLGSLTGMPTMRRAYTHHYERQPPGGAEQRVLGALFDRYDLLTTPADHLTAAMNSHFPGLARPFVTVPNGVDPIFASGTREQRWRLDLPAGAAVAVCVGRFVATKNQAALLDALATCASRGVNVGVLFVGTGPGEADLRRRSAQLGLAGRALFAGQVPRSSMPNLLASVDLAVSPSLTEASSVAIAEALVAGLPVVALDIPAMRETIGDAGVLVETTGLADGLEEAIRRRAELAATARQRGRGLRVTAVRRRWVALYEELLSGPP